jgi:PAS domain S-box-containing protein
MGAQESRERPRIRRVPATFDGRRAFPGDVYELFFRTNAQAMWVFDMETLAFLDVNDAAIRLYGYSREEFLSMTIREVRPPEEVESAVQAIQKTPRFAIARDVRRHRRKDGSVFEAEVCTHDLDIGGRRVGLTTSHVGSELQRIDGSLVLSESYFRPLIENALDVIAILGPNGIVRYGSPSVERVLGYTPGEFVGKSAFDFLHPEDVQRAFEEFGNAMRSKGPYTAGEFRFRHKDGSLRLLEVVGSNHLEDPTIQGIIVNARDTTARRKAEEEQREAERMFRALIERGSDILIVTERDGTRRYVSPSVTEILGYDLPEALALHPESAIHPEDWPGVQDVLRRLLEHSGSSAEHEFRMRHKDGTWRWMHAIRTNLLDEPGIQAIILTARDITERKEMERRLLEVERYASIGQMAAYVAHEINTPLTSISLLTAGISALETDPVIKQKLEKVDAQRRTAAKIIGDLLKFAPGRKLHVERADLRDLVRAAVDQVEAFVPASLRIRVDLRDTPLHAEVEAPRIEEVFVNLLKNAIHATPEGEVTVRGGLRAGSVWVAVADTGTGMTPEVLRRLFEPFFTTKPKGEGTGLGLALSKSLAVAHGGTIEVVSEAGRGSTFTVVLPRPAADTD